MVAAQASLLTYPRLLCHLASRSNRISASRIIELIPDFRLPAAARNMAFLIIA
jgi:hypothetical protein